MKFNANIVLVIVWWFVSAASANLLTNGSFEDVEVTAADDCAGIAWCIRASTSTPGWTQFANGVDLIHNEYVQGPAVLVDASDGVQFLDMNQDGTNGGIEQVVTANSGAQYRLELDTTAWAQNSIGGTIGYELYDPSSTSVLAGGTFTDNVGGTWSRRSIQAAAMSSQIGVRIQSIIAPQAAMGLDNVSLRLVGSDPSCDLNRDGSCDIGDIDLLIMEIAAGTTGVDYDLTGDGLVDLADRDAWLAQAGGLNLPNGNPYFVADFDLDGTVDGNDFLIWNSNKFSATGRWSQGDATADGTTDGSDFIEWNTNKFMLSDVNAVPDPSVTALLLGVLLGLPVARRGMRPDAVSTTRGDGLSF